VAAGVGGGKNIAVSGEVSSIASVDIDAIIKRVLVQNYQTHVYVTRQSPYIAQGVDIGGAED
jgi:hypothetical protein